jgi:CubicO group peptidase (beta-lactamase class C family)
MLAPHELRYFPTHWGAILRYGTTQAGIGFQVKLNLWKKGAIMSSWLWTILCVGIIGVTPTLNAALRAADDGVIEVGATGKRIVNLVKQAHRESGFTGAVLAAERGKVIAAVAVGAVGDDPLKVSALFELASCTKPFTAIAVLKLVEEGKLSLDDSIADHLPGVPDSCRAITVRHLLQHTSGIPGTNSNGAGTDLAVVLPTFLEGGPRSTPGERHEYWNQGYALLSEVIARASGKPYKVYCREAIFKPCKMDSTCFTGDRPPPKVQVAIGRSTFGRDRSALEHPYGEYGFQYRGMGGMVTNLVDLWRWRQGLTAGKLLKEESLKEMLRPGPHGYALGWRINDLDDGRIVQEHTGKVRGFLASIRLDPTSDGCLFVLANSDDSLPFELVKSACEAALAGAKPSATLPQMIAAKLAEELMGSYRDRGGRTLTVRREGELTQASIDWHGPITQGYLNPTKTEQLSYDQMISTNPPKFKRMNVIRVTQDKAGRVTRLTISDLNPPLTFERVAE